jgi:hypothetical protein
MSMRLTDGQLRTFAVRADYPLQDAAAELLALRERVTKLEAAVVGLLIEIDGPPPYDTTACTAFARAALEHPND